MADQLPPWLIHRWALCSLTGWPPEVTAFSAAGYLPGQQVALGGEVGQLPEPKGAVRAPAGFGLGG